MEFSLLNESPNASLFQDCNEHFDFPFIWMVVSVVCFILGFPTTLVALRELLQRSCQNMSNELFYINTVMINLIYLLIIPFDILNSKVWNYKPFECIVTITDALTLCARPLFMACVCADCYFAVVRPIAYRANKKSIIRKAACVIVWLSTIGFSSHKCSKMQEFPPPLNSAPLIFALPVISYCNIAVLQALRQGDPTRKDIHPQKKRVLHTIFISLVMVSVVYVPPVVIFSFADLIPLSRKIQDCTVDVFGYMLPMLGCVMMSIMYLNNVGKLDPLKDWLKKKIVTDTASQCIQCVHSSPLNHV